MRTLVQEEIGERQEFLCNDADRVDIATYNVHIGRVGRFLRCTKTRLIVGAPEIPGERQSTISSTAVATATQFRKVETRILLGSHVKLFIAFFKKRTLAIVGSQNLGQGHPYELAVELSGSDAQQLSDVFSQMWKIADPVKPLDLDAVRKHLSSSEFEV